MSGYYRTETYTYNVEQSTEDFIGFDDINVCRPKLIYFKVTGLRPNTRHFAFFDNTNVSNYINTSISTINEFKSLARNDIRRNPGEKYINETGFPVELGGPTGSIYSDSEGKIEGIFYLQSNTTVNFPAGTRTLSFIDISTLNPSVALSYANGIYSANGGVENYNISYYTVSRTGSRQVWVDLPDPPVSVEVNDNGGAGSTDVSDNTVVSTTTSIVERPENDLGHGDNGSAAADIPKEPPPAEPASPTPSSESDDNDNNVSSTRNVYLGPAGYETSPSGRVYSVGARYGTRDENNSPSSSPRHVERPDRDSGGGGGNDKIVCTAMNEAYGFGSFRQKIWLAHSHNMAPEYQVGYHAIFLPWVKHMYDVNTKNTLSAKAMRWWGEGFARRRTADIWAQNRGKKRKLSVIVERKILESICFATGWIITKTGIYK